jgi:hypothetical protein
MVVGKFGSVSNAVNPISKMTKSIATDDSLDIILLSLLPDFMVNSHRPKDTVLIGIGLPSTLCVAHEDLVRGLYLVDYFFCVHAVREGNHILRSARSWENDLLYGWVKLKKSSLFYKKMSGEREEN